MKSPNISKMYFVWKPCTHLPHSGGSASASKYFQMLPAGPSLQGSYTLQNHFPILPKTLAVMVVYSGCYEFEIGSQNFLSCKRPLCRYVEDLKSQDLSRISAGDLIRILTPVFYSSITARRFTIIFGLLQSQDCSS